MNPVLSGMDSVLHLSFDFFNALLSANLTTRVQALGAPPEGGRLDLGFQGDRGQWVPQWLEWSEDTLIAWSKVEIAFPEAEGNAELLLTMNLVRGSLKATFDRPLGAVESCQLRCPVSISVAKFGDGFTLPMEARGGPLAAFAERRISTASAIGMVLSQEILALNTVPGDTGSPCGVFKLIDGGEVAIGLALAQGEHVLSQTQPERFVAEHDGTWLQNGFLHTIGAERRDRPAAHAAWAFSEAATAALVPKEQLEVAQLPLKSFHLRSIRADGVRVHVSLSIPEKELPECLQYIVFGDIGIQTDVKLSWDNTASPPETTADYALVRSTFEEDARLVPESEVWAKAEEGGWTTGRVRLGLPKRLPFGGGELRLDQIIPMDGALMLRGHAEAHTSQGALQLSESLLRFASHPSTAGDRIANAPLRMGALPRPTLRTGLGTPSIQPGTIKLPSTQAPVLLKDALGVQVHNPGEASLELFFALSGPDAEDFALSHPIGKKHRLSKRSGLNLSVALAPKRSIWNPSETAFYATLHVRSNVGNRSVSLQGLLSPPKIRVHKASLKRMDGGATGEVEIEHLGGGGLCFGLARLLEDIPGTLEVQSPAATQHFGEAPSSVTRVSPVLHRGERVTVKLRCRGLGDGPVQTVLELDSNAGRIRIPIEVGAR